MSTVSYCSDPAMLPFLSVIRTVFQMIQILGPILSIVALMILFFKLMTNPEDPQNKIKNGIKNSIISLVILFLLPAIVNLTMYILGDKFTVSECWNAAKDYKAGKPSQYYDKGKDKIKIIDDDKSSGQGSVTTNMESSDMADAFVNLALAQKKDPSAKGGKKYWQYIGKKHHTAWCAAFVSWVIGNTEYNGDKMTNYFDYKTQSCGKMIKYCRKHEMSTYHQPSNYTPKRGDLIFFDWDNDGYQNHIGIVQYVKDGKVKTIEGNCHDKVKERNIGINNKKIFGYCSWY